MLAPSQVIVDKRAGALYPASVEDEPADEPERTLWAIVAANGAGVVLKALARILTRRRKALRVEGELGAAEAARDAARACHAHAKSLRDADV